MPSQRANSSCGTLPRCPYSSPSTPYIPLTPSPCKASDVLGALGLNFICNNIYITGKVSHRMEGGQEWLLEVKLGASGEGKKKGNKRRFSDEQIRLLEMMFEEETKLEPKKKLQAARELGLQPRQVAIWFQNRRARWKSKQLEREYNVLKANYDALAQSYDSLKKEKQSLLKHVKKLSERLEKPEKRSIEGSQDHDDDSDKAPTKSDKAEEKLKLSMGDGADLAFSACSVEENSISCIESFRPEESDMIPIVDPAGAESSSIVWPEDWADLDSGSFSDQSCCTMEWWDFWA